MGLRDIATAIKNTPNMKPFDPKKPLVNFIDSEGNGVKIVENLNWEECKYVKMANGGRPLCTQFFGYCVKEKCKKKYAKF